MKSRSFVIIGYGIASVLLVLYSYTQVDLNLTLSRIGAVSQLERAFQHVGYYQRPLSALLYTALLTVWFVLYGWILRLIKRRAVTARDVWRIIAVVAGIVVFSYPAAFSYDFFNYLFTAKTILVYHMSPYAVTPLQFAGIDPWTNFMRWTHLSSAYTPLWIGLTLVPYVLGLGYFVPVLFLLKFMVAGLYIAASRLVEVILARTQKDLTVTGLAVFALNPLIVVESLVSGHNDILLAVFALLAVWEYTANRHWSAVWYMAWSAAAKMVTVVLIPLIILKKRISWMLAVMCIVLIAVGLRREFLPWYWVWIMPFVALLPRREKFTRFASVVSFGLLASYTPYIYTGSYVSQVQAAKTAIIWGGVLIGAASLFLPVRSLRKTKAAAVR